MCMERATSSNLALTVPLARVVRHGVDVLHDLGTLLGELGLNVTVANCFLHRDQRQH
jgi:hypothetical protein